MRYFHRPTDVFWYKKCEYLNRNTIALNLATCTEVRRVCNSRFMHVLQYCRVSRKWNCFSRLSEARVHLWSTTDRLKLVSFTLKMIFSFIKLRSYGTSTISSTWSAISNGWMLQPRLHIPKLTDSPNPPPSGIFFWASRRRWTEIRLCQINRLSRRQIV